VGYGTRYVEAMARMVCLGAGYRPAVVHAHDIDTLPVALAIRMVTGARIVYDAHELYRDCVRGIPGSVARALDFIETHAMRQCAGIIACNRHRAEIMRNEYGAPFLPLVVRNVPWYRPRRRSEYLRRYVRERNPGIEFVVLHQGAIVEGRGIHILVRALALLPARVGCVLVGGGAADYIGNLQDLAQGLGVGNRFFHHAAVDAEQLHEICCSADVGVVIYQNTCRNNYFCASNKIYEYAAAGVPIAAADLPPLREFLTKHACGYLFAPESPEDLARVIGLLLADRSAYLEFRRAGMEAAKVDCWEIESKKLLSLYERILGRAGRGDCRVAERGAMRP